MVSLILMVNLSNACEHLREVALHHLDLLGVTNDLEQILISHEVEPSKVLALGLQVVNQSLLNLVQHV